MYVVFYLETLKTFCFDIVNFKQEFRTKGELYFINVKTRRRDGPIVAAKMRLLLGTCISKTFEKLEPISL